MPKSIGNVKNALLVAAFVAVGFFALERSASLAQSRPAMLTAVHDSDELCIERALSAYTNNKTTRQRVQKETSFLAEGESHSISVTLNTNECVAVFAMGRTFAKNIELALYDTQGGLLSRAQDQRRFEYLRYCGVKGFTFNVALRMLEGRSETLIAILHETQGPISELIPVIQRCFSPYEGSHSEPLTNVGPEPDTFSIESVLESFHKNLQELGYHDSGVEVRSTLIAQQMEGHVLRLNGGRCYALVGAAGLGVGDIDIIVRAVNGTLLGADVSRDRNAIAKLCTQETTDRIVEVHMYQGAGEYAIHVYDLAPSPIDLGFGTSTAVTMAEVSARLSARGMTLGLWKRGLLQPDKPLIMPVDLSPHQCYAFVAVGSAELRTADIDLSLVDDSGEFLAWDVSGSNTPLIFHCPSEKHSHQLIGHIYGGQGLFSLLIAKRDAKPKSNLEKMGRTP